MPKYEIKDAVMLKECMKQIAEIKAKYAVLAAAKQSGLTLAEQVIGADEEVPDAFDKTDQIMVIAQNALRAEQRARIKALQEAK